MKKIKLVFVFICALNIVIGQNQIFKQEQVLLNTNSDGWNELFIVDDINEDGKWDYFGLEDYTFVSYIASGDSLIWTEIGGASNAPLKVLDFDNDGKKDILDGSQRYYKNMGNDSFAHIRIDGDYFYLNTYDFYEFKDIDNNGYHDILAENNGFSSAELNIYYNSDTGFIKVIVDDELEEFGYAKFMELNGDTLMDIVMTTEYSSHRFIVFYLNNGDRTFTKKIINPTVYNKGNYINVDDLDGDGDKDILFYRLYGGIYLIENDNGEYKKEVKLNDFNVQVSKLSDIDNDGDLDIIFIDEDHNNRVNIYYQLNNGDLVFGQAQKMGSVLEEYHYFGSNSIYNIIFQLLDINGDNSIDVVLNAPDDKKIVWFENKTVVLPQTSIVTQPVSQTVCEESTVTFSVIATGDNLSYQWQKSGVEITGETKNTLEILKATLSDAGDYTCVVSGTGGMVTSDIATLKVNQNKDIIMNIVACELFELNGQEYTETGNYTQDFTTNTGCDSILNLNLTIINLNISVSVEGDSLIASDSNADKYTWIDCNTNTEIVGASQRIFAPQKSGSYSVKIEKDGCEKTSDCIDIILSYTQEEKSENTITIFPNPTTQKFKILGLPNGTYDVGIYDISGKQVLELKKQNISKNYKIDMSKYKDGVYFLSIKNKDVLVTKKVLKVE